jgi:hypothetical protein
MTLGVNSDAFCFLAQTIEWIKAAFPADHPFNTGIAILWQNITRFCLYFVDDFQTQT